MHYPFRSGAVVALSVTPPVGLIQASPAPCGPATNHLLVLGRYGAPHEHHPRRAHGQRLSPADVSSGEFEPRNCDSLPRGVSPAECDVSQAADGAAGLALLRAEQFDCLLLGADLPDMTAIEFLSAAAVDGAPPCMVVLVPSLRKPKPHPIAHSITSAVARLFWSMTSP